MLPTGSGLEIKKENQDFESLITEFDETFEFINTNKPEEDPQLSYFKNRDSYIHFVENLVLPEKTLIFLQDFESYKFDFEKFLNGQSKPDVSRILKILKELNFSKNLDKQNSRLISHFISYKETNLGINGKSLSELSLEKHGSVDICAYLKYISQIDISQGGFWQGFQKILKTLSELRIQPDTQQLDKALERLVLYDNALVFAIGSFLSLRDKTPLPKFTGFAHEVKKIQGKELETLQVLFQILLKRGLTLEHLILAEFPLKILDLLEVSFDKNQLKYYGVKSNFLDNNSTVNNSFVREQLEKGLVSQTLYNRLDAALDRMKNGATNKMYLPKSGAQHPAIIVTEYGDLKNLIEEKKLKIDFFDDKLELVKEKLGQMVNAKYDFENFCWYPEDKDNPDLLKRYAIPIEPI